MTSADITCGYGKSSMTKQNIFKVRLILNGIGCTAIAILCLPIGFSGIISLVSNSPPMGSDPDGADKVIAIQIFSGLLGALALISLIRTVKKWRVMN